jgi:hypothetical protein
MSASGDEDRESKARAAAAEAASEARARFRRNRMIGEWAAGLMGLDDGAAYARAVARSEADTPADEDVARKVGRDLADSGLAASAGEVPGKMQEFLAQARAQLGEAGS